MAINFMIFIQSYFVLRWFIQTILLEHMYRRIKATRDLIFKIKFSFSLFGV
jgi:hypothetical protein